MNSTLEMQPPSSRRHGGGLDGDVLKLVSGTSAAQALGILAMPILTRLYAPEAFGLMTLFVSIASLVKIVVCLRYEFAIPLPDTAADAAVLLTASLILTLIMTAVTALLVLTGGQNLATLLNAVELFPYLTWIPVFVGLSGIHMALGSWNARGRFFGRIATSHFAGAALTAGGKVGMGLAGQANAGSLISTTLAGQAVATCLLGLQTHRDTWHLMRSNLSVGRLRSLLYRYRKFPLFDTGSALLNNASWQVPPLLFAAFFSPVAVGFYALCFRFIQMPMSLIGASLGQAFYPRIASARNSGEPLDRLVGGVFTRLVTLSLMPSLLFAVAGPEIFSLVFGPVWRESGLYAQILSPWAFCWFIASPLGLVFNALEKQELLLGFNVAIFATRLLSILAGSFMGSMAMALQLFSLTGVLVYGYLLLKVLAFSQVEWGSLLKQMAPTLLAAMFLSLIVAALKVVHSNPLALTVASAVVMVIYAFLTLRRDHELLDLVFRFKQKRG